MEFLSLYLFKLTCKFLRNYFFQPASHLSQKPNFLVVSTASRTTLLLQVSATGAFARAKQSITVSIPIVTIITITINIVIGIHSRVVQYGSTAAATAAVARGSSGHVAGQWAIACSNRVESPGIRTRKGTA